MFELEHDQPDYRADRMCWIALAMLTLALASASIYRVCWLALFYTGHRPLVGVFIGWEPLDLWLRGFSTWPKFFAALGLLRLSSERAWRRRGALFLFCTMIDVGLWTIENGEALGFTNLEDRDHEWLRYGIGTAVGWSEFLLIAGMCSDVATYYGRARIFEFSRSIRSLALTGMALWFFFFVTATRWGVPGPLGLRRLTVETFLLWQAVRLIWTICLLQTTGLAIVALRSCGEALSQALRRTSSREIWPE